MPRVLDCPCPPETLTCVGDATGYGVFVQSTMQRVGRQASAAAIDGVKDASNNVSCAAGCHKQLSRTIEHKTLSEVSRRLWLTLFIVVECHVQYEASLTVTCVK